MPGITVDLNGTRIAAIDLAALHVMTVSVHGALDSEDLATLDASGGAFGNGGSGYRIWIDQRPLHAGDTVRVTFSRRGDGADPGHTIAQRYPDEAPCTRTDFTPDAQMAAELLARPRLREAFLVQAWTSSGQQASAASDERHTRFQFHVAWNWAEADQVRVALSTCGLDHVLARAGAAQHLQTTLTPGASAVFTLVR